MALFALIAHDKPNGLAHRMEVRPEHLKHLEALGDALVLAGPFLDDNGDMNGSIVVVEAPTRAEGTALLERDPFVKNGVFASYQVLPWRIGVNKTGGK